MSLPTIAPTMNGNKIDAVLAHMDDCHPDDATTVRMWLSARIQGTYTYAHQDIADALTDYCKDRKSTRLNSSHPLSSRMPSSA